MSIQVVTHLSDIRGKECHFCRAPLPRRESGKAWPPYLHVGLVVPTHTQPIAYAVGERDSNPRCDAKGTK